MNKIDEIIAFAKSIRKNWGANPFEIAERLGIIVNCEGGDVPSAYTLKAQNYPTIIKIKGCENNQRGALVLCAHELGHALLHNEGVNRFSGSYKSMASNTEYEANIFAVALLFDEKEFNCPINRMSNYTLKTVLDYNI